MLTQSDRCIYIYIYKSSNNIYINHLMEKIRGLDRLDVNPRVQLWFVGSNPISSSDIFRDFIWCHIDYIIRYIYWISIVFPRLFTSLSMLKISSDEWYLCPSFTDRAFDTLSLKRKSFKRLTPFEIPVPGGKWILMTASNWRSSDLSIFIVCSYCLRGRAEFIKNRVYLSCF